MKPCVWYVSKYVSPPTKGSAGSRGFIIMRELVKLGYQCMVFTSDSNKLAEVPKLHFSFLVENFDGLQLCWIRTAKYRVAKSIKRILSWLDFEWRLMLLPKKQFPQNILITYKK